MRERETIIYNVGDEPIVVRQSDGSHIIVPPGEKRPAELPNQADLGAAPPISRAEVVYEADSLLTPREAKDLPDRLG
jgi:hypothetical protein